MLTGSPKDPNDHRRGGSGAPNSRRQMSTPTIIIYELSTATPPRGLMALRATVEPRLMHARREVTSQDTGQLATGCSIQGRPVPSQREH